MANPTSGDKNRSRSDGSSLYLVVVGPYGNARHQLPARGTLTIGRRMEASVRLIDPLVAPHHALLQVDKDRVEIEDLGSSNGTILRGSCLKVGARAQWQPGETVTIGSTLLFLEWQ